MERIRFFFDEHVPQAVADGLRRRGVNVLTTLESGRVEFADEDQLSFATEQARVMMTMDADFLALDAQGAPHTGIAYAQQGSRTIGELIRALLLIYDVLEAAEMVGHVEYL